MIKKISFLVVFFITFFGSVSAVEEFPAYKDFVNDYTKTLGQEKTLEINSFLKEYEKNTGTEMAVVIVESTTPREISQYAFAIANEWGVGKGKVDNGVLLLVVKEDRKLFIATGSQTEGYLTDVAAKTIIDSVIKPNFKENNFEKGVFDGVRAIAAVLNNKSFTDLRMSEGEKSNSWESIFFEFWWVVFFLGTWVVSILARSKAIWHGGVLSGAMALVVVYSLETGIMQGFLWAAGAFGAGILFDWFISRNYQSAIQKGESPSWWAGGSYGSGRSGGGFGGFGGGGFGGGGAGGSW